MSYIGVEPKSGFIKADQEKITGQTTNYVNLTNSISSLDDVQIWVNYVIQDPSTLTLNSSTQVGLGDTLVSSDVVLVTYLGQSVATQTPDNNTITNDMLVGSIANSKLANSSITLNGSAVSLGGSATVGLSGWSENGADNDLLPSNADSGIYLGVNSATAANLLDHYEYGTWTPRLQGRTTQGTVNYSSGGGDGYYQRIGDIVHLWFWFAGSLSSASGELQMSGVPYNMSGGQTQYRINLGATNFAGRKPTFGAKFNNTTFEFYEETGSQDASGIGYNNSNVSDVSTNTVQVWGNMTYKTA